MISKEDKKFVSDQRNREYDTEEFEDMESDAIVEEDRNNNQAGNSHTKSRSRSQTKTITYKID